MFMDIWNRCNKSKIYIQGFILLLILVGEIGFTCYIPEWRNSFFSVMKDKHVEQFAGCMWVFAGLMAGLGFTMGIKLWLSQLFSFEFRRGASKLFLKKWVKGERSAPNYTQAMTEAVRNSTELLVQVGVEVFISASAVVILLGINHSNHKLIGAAIVYTLLTFVFTSRFNKPMVLADATWQSSEGRYREAISDIANGNGDYTVKDKFVALATSYIHYTKTVMYFTLFSRLQGSITHLAPYLLLSTDYFGGSMTFGEFMASVAVFELLVLNATIILTVYPQITRARASVKIMKEFYSDIQ